MATAAKTKPRKWLSRPPRGSAPQPATPPKRRRRWRWLAALGLLAALAWLLPAIVAHTPLLGWIVGRATSRLDGTVSVGSASLGWFSPLVVRDVEVSDADGQPVLSLPEARSGKSLAGLLWSLSSPGQFRLEKPQFRIVLRRDGSNVEDLLADYLSSTDQSPTVGMTLEVADGRVEVVEADGGRTWTLDQVQLLLTTPSEPAGTTRLKTSAVLPGPKRPGTLEVELAVRQHAATAAEKSAKSGAGETAVDSPASAAPATSGELTFKSDDLPLGLSQAIMDRFAPETRLAGLLDADVLVEWSGAGTAAKTAVQAELGAENLVFAAAALGADRVRLASLQSDCRMTRRPDRVEVERASLQCDLGTLALEGTLATGDGSASSLARALLREDWQLGGQIDLARLASTLPATLHVRPETRITGGKVELSANSRTGPQGRLWSARLGASGLSAVDRGRPIAWQQPILVTLAAHEGPQGPIVDQLNCDSDFLQIQASGTPDDAAASATFDLKRLAGQLGQFIDLGDTALAGDGWMHANWKRSADRHFETDGELHVRDLLVQLPGCRPWREADLLAFLSARGQTDFTAATRLELASVDVQAAGDRLTAELTAPVADLRDGGRWPVRAKLEGELDRWQAKLGNFVDLGQWQMAGPCRIEVEAVAAADAVELTRAEATSDRLRVVSPGLKIDEPGFKATAAGRWDAAKDQLRLSEASLDCATLGIAARELVLTMSEAKPAELSANLGYRADVARLLGWLGNEKPQASGRLEGTAEVRPAGGAIEVRAGAAINDLVVIDSSGVALREPQVRLAGQGAYEPQTGLLRIDSAEVASSVVAGRLAGQVAQAEGRRDVQLAGQVDYDLQQVAALLRPYLGAGVRVVGRGTAPVSYRGPLDPAEAEASTSLKWQRADVYGFAVGPGELQANLAGGVVVAEPIDVEVSGGRMRLAPSVRLAPSPMVLGLPPGPLAQQVQITPAMCAAGLQYIAPVLAGVTAANGTFSIELKECRIPLADPGHGRLAGRFIIHSIEVGPGPLIREMAVLLGREKPASLRRESAVEFVMADGRVYHQGLELIFPELTIRTHGSVGLDQSLALVAEMPVPPKLLENLGNTPLAAALRNQTVTLPIGGTLGRPQLDRRALDELNRRFLQNAARNVIGEEIGRQLNRLFPPQQ